MKIAQIAPVIERVPPKKYGGTERVVYALTEELVRRGHQVTLFASGDSITSAKLVSVYPKALREARVDDLYGPNYWSMLNIGLAYQKQDEFDIIHDHNGHLSLPTANISHVPTLFTIHGQFTTAARRLFDILRHPALVGISNSQISTAPKLNWAGMVHNGLEMDNYPFSDHTGGYLLFVGRISMEKGTHLAIEVAQYLNLPLIIAAKLEAVDLPYFNEYVGPRLSESVKWVGEVEEGERNQLMSKALCFLHPATWKEPFGLTLIEAMACGCPVVAFNKGSIPEIIKNGKTGFIVEDIDQMMEAVNNIAQINRLKCRIHALEKFNAAEMASGYEKIYKELLGLEKPSIVNLPRY